MHDRARPGFLVTLDVHQHVVRLVHFLDRVGHLATTPVFETVNLAALGVIRVPVAFDHGGAPARSDRGER